MLLVDNIYSCIRTISETIDEIVIRLFHDNSAEMITVSLSSLYKKNFNVKIYEEVSYDKVVVANSHQKEYVYKMTFLA